MGDDVRKNRTAIYVGKGAPCNQSGVCVITEHASGLTAVRKVETRMDLRSCGANALRPTDGDALATSGMWRGKLVQRLSENKNKNMGVNGEQTCTKLMGPSG